MEFFKLVTIIFLVSIGFLSIGNSVQANEFVVNENILDKAKLLNIEPSLLAAIYQQDTNQNQKEPNNQPLGPSPAHEIYVFYKENVYWVVIKPNPTSFMSRAPTEEEWLQLEKQTIKAFMLPNVDSKTFVDLGFGYAKDQHQVYNQNMLIKDADPNTFQVISPYYVKDSRFVYFRPTSLRSSGYLGGDQSDFPEMRVIKGADPVTFDAVDKEAVRIPNLYYSKDNQYVYFAGEIMKEATPNSFSVFTQYPNYSTDNQTVYMDGEPCQNIDALSFKPVSYTIAKDKNNVYTRDR